MKTTIKEKIISDILSDENNSIDLISLRHNVSYSYVNRIFKKIESGQIKCKEPK